jgi:hypothetical protein
MTLIRIRELYQESGSHIGRAVALGEANETPTSADSPIQRRRVGKCRYPPAVLAVYNGLVVEVRRTIETGCEPSRVFEFITDIPRRPEWQRHLAEAVPITSGPVREGTRFRERGKSGPMVLEVTALDPDRHFRYATVGGKQVGVDLDWMLAATESGTRVEILMVLEPRGVLKRLWPIVGPLLVMPQVERDLDHLAQMLKNLT